MRCDKINRPGKVLLVILMFFVSVPVTFANQPDNAAELYNKAIELYKVDKNMKGMLAGLQKGEIEVDVTIRGFVNKNRSIIDMVLDAAEVNDCDWGLDYSQGLKMRTPHLGPMRDLARLIMADTKILSEDGDYERALDNCMSLHKMSRHINDRFFIIYLAATAIDTTANDFITQIISDMPLDLKNLTRLKKQLIEIDSIPLSVKPALLGERDTKLSLMTKAKISSVLNGAIEKKLPTVDEETFERNREYYKSYHAEVVAAFDMSYTQGYAKLVDLDKKTAEDVQSKPDAILTGFLKPAARAIFSLIKRFENQNNAIKAAIEIYIITAKTGQLPDKLPADLPKDLFSDKDFEYEITTDGFILRCQGKDLRKDKTYEYGFKVKK